ncbi:MAG: ABC transporter ATP-binding protein [Pseudomonadota bacterium]|nr:ABC transporter ATP-binding protein [Pseudomonadota bacterium]
MNINCVDITKSYSNIQGSNQNDVLKKVNLRIDEGEIIALTGPSGSGKTTLLNIISGLDNPSSGDVFFDKTAIHKLSLNQRTKFRNNNLGVVFQFFNLLDDFNVFENIAMPLFIKNENNSVIEQRVKNILNEIDLLNKINSDVTSLSGGESQRVAIARAMIGLPKLILADEPTGNLDKENTEKIISFLINTCKKNNISLLMVTHDRELLKKFEKVYSIESGDLKVFTC